MAILVYRLTCTASGKSYVGITARALLRGQNSKGYVMLPMMPGAGDAPITTEI